MRTQILSIKNAIILATGLMALTACEKVVDIDLNNAQPRIVIEGKLYRRYSTPTAFKDSALVKLSTSKSFEADNAFVGTAGGTVTISDDAGTVYPLTEVATGIFLSTDIPCEIGHTYTLNVTMAGQAYTASSTVQVPVPFTRLSQERQDFAGDERKVANVSFTDPVGKGNNYRFIQYRNGKAAQPIFILNDELSDGLQISQQLNAYSSNRDSDELQSGDILTVEMNTLDNAVYKFWSGLSLGSTGDGLGSIPGNPVTNLSGGALGYFSAHTAQFKSLVVK
jgi:hypothetical protein